MCRIKIDHKELLESLEVALRDPEHILTKSVENPLTRTYHREALTTFIIAEVMGHKSRESGGNKDYSVCKNEASEVHDGLILVECADGDIEEEIEVEQVMLTREDRALMRAIAGGNISEHVIAKIQEKHEKHYSDSKKVILNVFFDVVGYTIPREVKQFLLDNEEFESYLLIVLDGEYTTGATYVYTVSDLIPDEEGHTRIHLKFDINDLSLWEVYE